MKKKNSEKGDFEKGPFWAKGIWNNKFRKRTVLRIGQIRQMTILESKHARNDYSGKWTNWNKDKTEQKWNEQEQSEKGQFWKGRILKRTIPERTYLTQTQFRKGTLWKRTILNRTNLKNKTIMNRNKSHK